MTKRRLYFPGGMGENNYCKLGEEHLRYVKSVLRMKKGDRLILFDGAGWEYETVIQAFSSDGITVNVLHKEKVPDKRIIITLFQALPKAGKMDFIVQKATELGADRIIPFLSSRSIPQLTAEKATLKISRWNTIAAEAAKQCGRADIPEISDILSFNKMLAYPEREGLKIFFWEEESEKGIKDVLHNTKHEMIERIAVVIGPEGGFTKEEVSNAVEMGFISVSLGRNILKVETAALTILSIIQYEKGIFSGER
ncbi:MAG: 16S rRNA (uracil(1498)-N(3))-methyltransferase [Syntrophaceae bacterium]